MTVDEQAVERVDKPSVIKTAYYEGVSDGWAAFMLCYPEAEIKNAGDANAMWADSMTRAAIAAMPSAPVAEIEGLVERLRAEALVSSTFGQETTYAEEAMAEAADALEALSADRARMREALEPFAKAAEKGKAVYDGVKALLHEQPHLSSYSTAYIDAGRSTAGAHLSWNDYERARQALETTDVK